MVTILPQSVEFLIAIMTCDSNFLPQLLYHNQSIVVPIGDVICPNKKCRGKKCVYLTSLKKLTRAPTYLSIAKLSVTCSKFLLSSRNHVLPDLVGPTAFYEVKFGLPERETIASNATVHPPIKTFHDKSRGS